MATSSQGPADSTTPPPPQQTHTPMEPDAAPNPTSNHQTSNDNDNNNDNSSTHRPESTPEEAQAQAQADPEPAQPRVTPGPRAARLQELYAQSLRRTLGKLKWEHFAACYPTVAQRAEPVLRQVQVQMVEKLGEKCEKEFESILVARQVVPKLNDLEALVSEATHRRITAPPDAPKPTPPHLLPAREILSAHLAPSLASHQSLLNARLQTAQSHNAILYEQIRAQRAEVERLLELLEGTVGDVRSANAALEPVVKLLAREAREADRAVSEE
ncbi:Nnf1 domain-containing protein [Trichoderma novae-zelandiae]